VSARSRSRNDAFLSAALFAFAAIAYAVLGAAVSHRPPAGIDASARALAGSAPRIAWLFTASCLWPTLTTFGAIAVVAAIRSRAWRGRIVFALVTTLTTWQLSDVLKTVFARPRPTYWYLYHEPSFAYSSGHAMFAVLVYGLWAYHAARSGAPPPVRAGLCALLAGWGGAVLWSRLALGAHYPSDLLGGVLLAIAMLALAYTIATLAAPRARVL
jgi:undecaprenyl-diphosphatase